MTEPFYQMISDFIFVEDKPQPAQIIFLPGGHFPESAIRAASLYHQGFAPLLLPSGKWAKAAGHFPGPFPTEWAYLSDLLLREGVPGEAILREDQATFTYENAVFSRRVCDGASLRVSRAILCCQAFHARRSLMYYQQQFPEANILVCPVVTRGIDRDSWYRDQMKTDIVLGEVERIGAQFHCVLPLPKDIGERGKE